MIQTFVGQWFRRKSRQHTVVADTRIEGSDKLRWTISRIQWSIHKKCIKAPGAAPKVSFGPNLWVLDSQTGWQPQFRLVPKSWIHADWGWLLVRFSQRFRKVSKSHGAAPKVTQIPKLRTLVGSVIRTVSKTKNLTDTKSAGFHKSSRSISEIQWNLEKSVQVVWCCPYSTRSYFCRSVTRRVPNTNIQADQGSDRFSMVTNEIQWNIHKSAPRCQIQTVVGWSLGKCPRVTDTKNPDSDRFRRSISEIQCNIHKKVSSPLHFCSSLLTCPHTLVSPPQTLRPLSVLRGVCPPDEVAKVTTVIIFTYF